MSLINEALKKAQRERTETTADDSLPPGQTGAPAPSGGVHFRRARPDGPPLLLLAGGAIALLGVLVIAGVLFFRRPEPVPVPVAAARLAAAAPVTTALTPKSFRAPAGAPLLEPATQEKDVLTVHTEPAAFTLPLNPPEAAPEPAAVVRPAAKPRAREATAAAPARAPGPPVATVAPDAQMIDFIEGLRVTGIRASGAESKVLMNDRVYRLHDIVNHEQGIRLTGVATGALTFENEHGAVYTRQF